MRDLCTLVLAAAVSAACASKPALPAPIPERQARAQVQPEGERTRVTLPGFEAVEHPQETPVWCWAACAAMILRYGGVEASQAEIAARIHGYEGDAVKVAAASRYEVYRALCPDAPAAGFDALWAGIEQDLASVADDPKAAEGSFHATLDADEAVAGLIEKLCPAKGAPIGQLLQGDPAVAGLRDAASAKSGHVYVLVGASYRPRPKAVEQIHGFLSGIADSSGNGATSAVLKRLTPKEHVIHDVELVDPLAIDDPETPEDEMRVRLSLEEFSSRVDFVTTRLDAEEILARWSRMAVVEVK